ncbi:hypothetical protein A2W14_03870 [Candidatus Gottesmanbacteria bacterium RBG_16_37_8]|uniref:SCP domain-containing protein n=1 Tax=Candidatus Gottesmanbacteria bacterium RBG_16_37_8 TaxID=1798371 RepID=A0A1F5YQZ1_9BACT|nr:MAG: hypothetical protein A2W14_03870 [Candidatus Gottesmanbacteria bacterium RBG_16_37_8]
MSGNLSHKIRHYFFPHHTNNYKAKALHHSYLLFYIFLLIVFQSIYLFVKDLGPGVLGYATDISIEKILTLVNLERQKANLDPLTVSTELNTAAQEKAVDMFAKNYWAHISPTGTTPWEFITGSGYQYIYAGENLAKSFDNSSDVVAAWMKSPTHRANILKREYTEIGLAVKNGLLNSEETTLVVQEFGARTKPLVATVKTAPEEIAKETEKSQELAEVMPPVKEEPVTNQAGVTNENTVKHPLRINRTISLFIAEFMLVVLLIDSIFIWRHKTIRISGHSLAHVMFLLALLGAMSATGIGAIL